MKRSNDPLRRILVKQFGVKSSLAKALLPELEKLASTVPASFRSFIPAIEETSGDVIIARRLFVALISRSMLLRATEQLSIADIAWHRDYPIPDWSWLDAARFHQFHRVIDEGLADWWREQTGQPLVDPFLTLQHDLFPTTWRRRWGEFYTPEWLTDLVVGSVWEPDLRWLDPTAGAGAFALAVARQSAARETSFTEFVAFDRDPWSLLSAAASLSLVRWWLKRDRELPLSVGQIDVVHTPSLLGGMRTFDRVVGNPPWILWDVFHSRDRAEMIDLWREYGLHTESGMASILGGGKRDYSFLILLIAANRLLLDRGILSFVLPQSAFKSSTSARGLRRWRLPDQTPLAVESVDDLSQLQPFSGASVKTVVARIVKGSPTEYPVRYRVWTSKEESASVLHHARPADPSDELSSWHHEEPTESAWFGQITGECAYDAHLGVNTGGASGVYWLKKLGEEKGLWRMSNLADRGKKKVESAEALLEPDHLYPALLGKDVAPWRAEPSAWLLMVQDVSRRRGIDEDVLREMSPRTLAYLRSFESFLRSRAAQKRYFSKVGKDGTNVDTAPFYSMFNVGTYTLAPIKVVWNRMGNRLAAAVISHIDGKLVFPQETHCFFGAETWDEGDFLAALLNSDGTQRFLSRLSPNSSKSFGTPRVMQRLRIRWFDPNNEIDRKLSELGRRAREECRSSSSIDSALKLAIDLASAAYWEIPSFHR